MRRSLNWGAGDWEALETKMHRAKGSASTIGAAKLAALAYAIMVDCRTLLAASGHPASAELPPSPDAANTALDQHAAAG